VVRADHALDGGAERVVDTIERVRRAHSRYGVGLGAVVGGGAGGGGSGAVVGGGGEAVVVGAGGGAG
jgi:hypothetical protein